MKQRLLHLFIILSTVLPTFGETGRLFTADDHLPSSMVNSVMQDRDGYVWIGTRSGLCRYDGHQFTYFNSKAPGRTIADNVLSMSQGSSHLIYIGTERGAWQYEPSTMRFTKIITRSGTNVVISPYVQSILARRNGDVLIATSGDGTFVKRPGSMHATLINTPRVQCFRTVMDMQEDSEGNVWMAGGGEGLMELKGCGRCILYMADIARAETFTSVCTDRHGDVWAGTTASLYCKRRGARRFVKMAGNLYVNTLRTNSHGQLMVGTEGSGMLWCDTRSGKLTPAAYRHHAFDMEKTKVKAVMEDREGNVWLGLYQKGLFVQSRLSSSFGYMGYRQNNNIGNCCVSAVMRGRDGTLWVGTDGDGLYAVNAGGRSRHYDTPATVLCIKETTDGRLFVGSYLQGAGMIDRNTGRYTQLDCTRRGDAIHVLDMEEDRDGILWIATNGEGLKGYHLKTGETETFYAYPTPGQEFFYNKLSNNWVKCLRLSHDGKRLYIGMSNGITALELRNRNFTTTFNRNYLMQDKSIFAIREDAKGNLWIGTDGLYYLNIRTRKFRCYTTRQGLPSNHIMSLETDHSGNLWISTSHGLCHFNLRRNTIESYYASDGLQGNEFSDHASCAINGREMVFGGLGGVTLFQADKVGTQRKRLTVYLTDFNINGNTVTTESRSIWLGRVTEQPVIASKRFDLSYHDNTFSISLSTLDYAHAEGMRYQYSINGDGWQTLAQGVNTITLSNAAPGTYHFRVLALLNGAKSNIREFTVVINPPFYASWLAYILYVLFVAGIIVWYLHTRRLREKATLRLQEHLHATELNEARLHFFMNISHEIRTPMTLIMSPLQQLMGSDKDSARQRMYTLMKRNAERVISLVSQILDIHKIDKGMMALHYSETDMVAFVHDLYEMFDTRAQERHISFTFEHDSDTLPVWIDRQNFDKVVMNLLSNAFKYTPEGGEIGVTLTHDGSRMRLAVGDNGESIDEDKLDKVFLRFYQQASTGNETNMGTGIGLHLTRQLVLLHHGTIDVRNNKEGGCTFTVTLPLGNAHLKASECVAKKTETAPTTETETAASAGVQHKRKQVMIVEDDMEIREYLKGELRHLYSIVTCDNGKEALTALLKQTPDLVVSDVMMPEMDGYTLCKKIKNNVNVNMVPVILLTAKNTEEDKVEGLELGADTYIEKPFNIDVLKLTIRNLMQSRLTISNKLSDRELPPVAKEEEEKTADEKLLARVVEIINQHIDDAEFSVEQLITEVGISRSHLHRKMKELTNQTTRDFIRNIRLKRAANMLEGGKQSVTEIMYSCGFDNSATFSIAFKHFYGVSPSEYMQEHQKKDS